MKKPHFKSSRLVLIVLLVFAVNSCKKTSESIGSVTQVAGSLAGIALTGPVNGIIDKFQEAAGKLLRDGENTGNALMSTMGNNLQVATINAKLAFVDGQNRTFDNLDNTSQSFFTQLNSLLASAREPLDRAVSVAEIANLNLMELTNRLPLTEKSYSYINKINGLMQVHSESGYLLDIVGLGFGQDLDYAKYKWTLVVGNDTLPSSALAKVPPFQLAAKIDNKVLEKYFKDSTYSFVPLTIIGEITVNTTSAFIFKGTRQVNPTWALKLTLLPRFPGKLTVVEILKNEVLDGNTKTRSIDGATSGCSSNNPCTWTREIRLASNERVVNARMSCVGQCGWSYAWRPGHGDPDFDVLEGGTAVKFYRLSTSGNPVNITNYVDYQTLKEVRTERIGKTIDLQFNKLFTINLNEDNRSCSYRLVAKLVTGQEIFLDNSMTESADKLLTRKGDGVGPAGLACSPSFILNTP